MKELLFRSARQCVVIIIERRCLRTMMRRRRSSHRWWTFTFECLFAICSCENGENGIVILMQSRVHRIEASVCVPERCPTHRCYRHRRALISPLRSSICEQTAKSKMVWGNIVCANHYLTSPFVSRHRRRRCRRHHHRHSRMHSELHRSIEYTHGRVNASQYSHQCSAYSCYLCIPNVRSAAVHSIIIHLDFILICCGCQCLFINNYTSFFFFSSLRCAPFLIISLVQFVRISCILYMQHI